MNYLQVVQVIVLTPNGSVLGAFQHQPEWFKCGKFINLVFLYFLYVYSDFENWRDRLQAKLQLSQT